MTCEVLVANRLGIALAADSAVTFTNGNASETTYASGANKIFQLAGSEPVAVMVYNQATLNRVPWEVILKAYRREIGARSFDNLKTYVDDLIEFINNRSGALLPPELREASSRSALLEAFFYTLQELLHAQPVLKDAGASVPDLQAAWALATAGLTAAFAASPVDPVLDAADLAALRGSAVPDLASQVGPFLASKWPHLVPVVDPTALVDLGLQSLFSRPKAVLSDYSGLVIAGYGAAEFMPSFHASLVYGFVGTRIYWHPEQTAAVKYLDNASLIEPFARKSMIETFTQGASPEVWKSVRDAFVKHAAEVTKRAAGKAGHVISQADIDAAVADELGDFTKNWAFSVFGAHLDPLKSVIAGLNVDELSELAETLVMLESLKEKVTSRTQGVGGPIDVAVITKSEGLVWIKRKHYFNPELNQRYLLRLQRGA